MANVGYIRVSTVQQNTERQLAGVQLDKVFTDKLSGKDTERPALAALMDYVREGDTVHVHELSRLGRSTADMLALIEQFTAKGVVVQFHKEGLNTASNNAMGRMMLTVIAAVAQAEREMMLERQQEGYAAARAAGRVPARGNGKAVDRAGILKALQEGGSIRSVAEYFKVSTQTVQRIKKEHELSALSAAGSAQGDDKPSGKAKVQQKRKAPQKRAQSVWRLQYRSGGQWVNGSAYPTKAEAETAGRLSGQDYQAIKEPAV